MTDGYFIVDSLPVRAPDMIDVRNFWASGVPQFRGERLERVSELMMHESVTRSWKATIRILRGKNASIHFTIDRHGKVRQHGDLHHKMEDAGAHNRRNVGIEVTNPYYPRYLTQRTPWKRVIKAGWADDGEYVVPLPIQAEAACQLTAWLTSDACPLAIPRAWRGLNGDRFWMGDVPHRKKAWPGIWAHDYASSHTDGAWLVLYAWLRLEIGLTPENAYSEAIRRATGVSGSTYIGDLLPGGGGGPIIPDAAL